MNKLLLLLLNHYLLSYCFTILPMLCILCLWGA